MQTNRASSLLVAILASIPAAQAANVFFEANAGQAPSGYAYVARWGSQSVLLSATEATLLVSPPPERIVDGRRIAAPAAQTITMQFAGALPDAAIEGGQVLESETHYFLGRAEPFHARHYKTIRARSVYPGIDVLFYSNGGTIEHDFVVAPGADPAAIRLRFSGTDPLRLDSEGNLVLAAGDVQLVERVPAIYQETAAGRREIAGRFRLLSGDTAGFEIDAYDRARPLIIDPIIVRAAGYLGGSGEEHLEDLEIDPTGNIVVAGYTVSTNFPGTTLVRKGAPPTADVFVTKFDPNLERVIWSAVIGGALLDDAYTMSINHLGQIFVAGTTNSSDFPTMNPFQAAHAGNSDVFILGLPPEGNRLIFSTFHGGAKSFDSAYGSTVDPAGNFYYCGFTQSDNFPTTTGAFQRTFGGAIDALFGSVTPAGQQRAATLLGGTAFDDCEALAFRDGNVYFTGNTSSPNLPYTSDRFQPAIIGESDVLIGVMNSTLSQVSFLSPFGGDKYEYGFDIVVNPMRQVAITGITVSRSFPAAPGFPARHNGAATGSDSDGFFAVFDFHPLIVPKPTLIQSGLVGGTAGDGTYALLPIMAPDSGFIGLLLFGGAQSAITSTLPGTLNCIPPAMGNNLAIFHISLGTDTRYGGCFSQGVLLNAAMSRDVQAVAGIVNTAIPAPTPNDVFDPTHNGATDAGVFLFQGFHDPMRLDGAIGIEQITYDYGSSARMANSTDAQLWLNLKRLPEQYQRGYLNVNIPGVGWVGQNLRFDRLADIDTLSTPIRLTNTAASQRLTSMNVEYRIDAEPISGFTAPGTRMAATLAVTPRLESTFCLGPVTAAPPPTTVSRNFDASGETWEHVLRGSAINVQSAHSQCGPAAMANSLQWLESQHSTFVVPHENVPGLTGDQSLVGQLDAAMARSATSRTSGSGLFEQQQLQGKFAYLSANNLSSKLEHKFQGPIRNGSGAGSTSDFSASGSTAKNDGAKPTFDWVCDQIKVGEDVELVYEWTGGSHLVRVFGCGMVRGAPYLLTLDDGVQTNNDPGDAMGIRARRIFVSNLGTADLHWDDLSKTVVSAIAESFTTQVKQTPGGSPITWREAITHGASFVKNLFTQGSVGTAFGFFPSLTAQANDAPRAALANRIVGTEVLLNGAPIPLYLATAGQINFQIPSDLPNGQYTLQVRQGDRLSAAATIDVQSAAPGIFLIGANRGAIQNQDFSLHTPQSPAKSGQALIVYLTGLGKKDTLVPAGQESPASTLVRAVATVTATIGGQNAPVAFAGLTPGFIGLEQVNLSIPSLPAGEYPLVITVGGVASNSVLVNVAE